MRFLFITTALTACSSVLAGCATPQERRIDSLAMKALPESERAKHRGFAGAARSAGYGVGGVLAAPILFAIDPSGKKLSH